MARKNKGVLRLDSSHRHVGAWILIVIGVIFLLQQYALINFGNLWPLILIVIGGAMLMNPNRKK